MAVFNPGNLHQLKETSAEIIKQLASYAAIPEEERDPDDSGIARQIQIVAASLNGALDTLNRMPMPMRPGWSPGGM